MAPEVALSLLPAAVDWDWTFLAGGFAAFVAGAVASFA
jgi:hypothetical protein